MAEVAEMCDFTSAKTYEILPIYNEKEETFPELNISHQNLKNLKSLGLALVTLDLAVIPITYYYALKFGTHLTLRQALGTLSAVFGLINFTHYIFRSLKLLTANGRPIGWTGWGMLEFLQTNILVLVLIVELELILGTMTTRPWIRLCSMPAPTIFFYLGFLSCGSAMLASMGKRLPFNLSSTKKGQVWRPVLLAFIEDIGALEGSGGVVFRRAVINRWELSPKFRSMIMSLSWIWGMLFIVDALVATVLVYRLGEDIGFGVGWGLPWACAVVQATVTVPYVKNRVKMERIEWMTGDLSMSTKN